MTSTGKEATMKFLLTVTLMLATANCGTEKKVVDRRTTPVQQPAPTPPTAPTVMTFENTIKPLVNRHCALSGCHAGAGYFDSEANFLNSRSRIRVSNGTMPPQFSPIFSQWTNKEKDIFTRYFDSK
jgi:hypothetical protein